MQICFKNQQHLQTLSLTSRCRPARPPRSRLLQSSSLTMTIRCTHAFWTLRLRRSSMRHNLNNWSKLRTTLRWINGNTIWLWSCLIRTLVCNGRCEWDVSVSVVFGAASGPAQASSATAVTRARAVDRATLSALISRSDCAVIITTSVDHNIMLTQ